MTPTTPSTAPHGVSLPDAYVLRIFEHMSCCYGAKFLDMWAGQDLATVRAYWGRKLGGFVDQPQAIKVALDALDGRPFPPTLPEFLDMCRVAARRQPAAPALPPPRPDAETVKARTASISSRMRDPYAPSLGWAELLRKKYLAGERLYPVQIRMASEALGEVWNMGKIEIQQREAA